MSKKVIAFVGMPGSGKSTVVEYLAKKGIPNVYLGGITVQEVKRRGLEVNETNEKMVREELRTNEGPGVMALRIIPEIDKLHESNEVVVADGIYSWSEYKIFKDRFGDNAIIIAIAAPRNTRHNRLANRPIRPLSKEQVIAREHAEIENIEKGGPIANADYTLLNDRSQTELIDSVQKTLKEVGISI